MEATQFEIGKLIEDVPYELYASAKGVRASDLKLLKRSPAHFIAGRKEGETSDALEFGKLFHLAVENPQRFLDTFHAEPAVDRRTKIGQEAIKAFYASVPPGVPILKPKWQTQLLGMLKSVMGHRLVSNLIRNGFRECSLWAQDDDTGLLLKCRPDFVTQAHGQIVDFKTCENALWGSFGRQVYADSRPGDPFYVLAAAHYAHIARLSRQCNGESFTFVAIEKDEPWGIMVYPMDTGAMEPGELWRKFLTRVYAQCERENHWPCYPEKAEMAILPNYVSEPPNGYYTEAEVGF